MIDIEDYRPVIMKAVWKFHADYNLPLDELEGIGILTFYEIQPTYDPAVAAFTTYLHNQLTQRFWASVPRYYRELPHDRQWFESKEHPSAEAEYKKRDFKQVLQRLSADTREVVNIILNTPSEILEILPETPNRYMRGAIKRYLLKTGWHPDSVKNAFREIRQTINDY